MSLSITLDQLKSTLSNGRAERVYTDARARQLAFAPYETIGAVLAACERGAQVPIARRDAIFAAMVTELQASSDPFWRSLLLVVFTPMLVRIRAALRRPVRNDPNSEDLDQQVLLAFVETARSLAFRSYVARNLWLLTRAELFAERRNARRAPRVLPFNEETHPCDPFRAEVQQRAAAVQIVRIIEAEGGEELRDLLLATCESDDSVQEYVDRVYADCNARVRARASKRLRRARLEVFAKLRVRGMGRGRPRAVAA